MDFGDGVGDNWHAAFGGFYGGVAACGYEIPAFAGMVYLVYGKLWAVLATVLATMRLMRFGVLMFMRRFLVFQYPPHL